MLRPIQGIVSLLGRVLLCAIFLLSAVGNKIPNFNAVAGVMESVGMPAPQIMLLGAIVFLIVGSVSVVIGFHARIGALLLLIFLALASYYFHAFWKLEGAAAQEQMIQFLKNLGLMGAMVFLIANGPGEFSVDRWLSAKSRV
jgi:putative oxidoreductase